MAEREARPRGPAERDSPGAGRTEADLAGLRHPTHGVAVTLGPEEKYVDFIHEPHVDAVNH